MTGIRFGLGVLIGALLLLCFSQVPSLLATTDIDGLMLVGGFIALLVWGLVKTFK